MTKGQDDLKEALDDFLAVVEFRFGLAGLDEVIRMTAERQEAVINELMMQRDKEMSADSVRD